MSNSAVTDNLVIRHELTPTNGTCFPIAMRTNPLELNPQCTKFELMAAIVSTNTTAVHPDVTTHANNHSMLQLTGYGSNMQQLPMSTRYALMQIDESSRCADSRTHTVSLSVLQGKNKHVDLRTGAMSLVPRGALEASPVHARQRRKHGLGGRLRALDRSIYEFERRCVCFYDQHVPPEATAHETAGFVDRGGTLPVVTASCIQESACELSMLCVDSSTDSHGQGGNVALCQVPIPCMSAGPVAGVTDVWARSGGDPGIVPLGMSMQAVARLNSLLYACSLSQRGLSYLYSLGATELADEENKYCMALLVEGYALMSHAMGTGAMCSKHSRVYVDRFDEKSRGHGGWCRDPTGGVQAMGPMKHTQTDATAFQTENGVHIPVTALSNIALFQFTRDFSLERGMTADVFIRTEADMRDILATPMCYGGGLHVAQESRVSTRTNETHRLANCRSYTIRESSGPSDDRLNETLRSAGVRFAAMQVCRKDNRNASTRTLRARESSSPSTSDTSLPYSMMVHAGHAESDTAKSVQLSSMGDWVCGTAKHGGLLLLQTDAPELKDSIIDKSECSMLRDSTTRLEQGFDVTCQVTRESIEAGLGLVPHHREMVTEKLREIEGGFVHGCAPDASLPDIIKLSRDNILPAYDLLNLARIVSDMNNNHVNFELHGSVYPAISEASIDALRAELSRRGSESLCIVAKAFLDALNALTYSIARCVPQTLGSQPGSFSKVRCLFDRHQEELGYTKDAIAIGAYPRRACVLVRTGPGQRHAQEDDIRVLMPSRQTGTDAEFFSNAPELASIKTASSVRAALTKATRLSDADIAIGRAWRIPVNGRRKCHTATSRTAANQKNPDDPTTNGLKFVTFAVEWKPAYADLSTGWRLACMQVNTCSSDRVFSSDDGKLHHDPTWFVDILRMQM
jgi:hypothetical protein